jgi:hypothetical protein
MAACETKVLVYVTLPTNFPKAQRRVGGYSANRQGVPVWKS